jgi:hexokinase
LPLVLSLPPQSEEVAIPPGLLVGTVAELFAFIATRVVAFAGRDAEGSLGFTFSFACAQSALDAGTLLEWTKGFALRDGMGADVVALLRAALADAGSCLRVAALVNDTVGTLAAARYKDPAACVAVILGTGAKSEEPLA